jgi:vitamin B12 transporter
MRNKVFSFIITAVLCTAGLAWAQDSSKEAQDAADVSAAGAKYDLGNVIVSATKTEIYQAEIGSSTTVITAEDIEKTGKRTVEEVLRDVPGLTVMQTGALGGGVSVFIRGANSAQTLVMIDGVEMNDPIDSSRAFNFANLLTDNVERIEIERARSPALRFRRDGRRDQYRYQKRYRQAECLKVLLKAGSHNTFTENLALRGTAIDKLDYSFSATHVDSSGISKPITAPKRPLP